MIKKITDSPKNIALIALVVVIMLGLFMFFRSQRNKATKSSSSGQTVDDKSYKYLKFGGDYVFDIPKGYNVDEQSLPGIQLVYTGTIDAKTKTIEDVYNNNGIAVQQSAAINDRSKSKDFKDYINNVFIPELKKNLSVSDVKTKFGSNKGVDNVKITATKDGKTVRYIYIKSGKHPAQVVAKDESESIKTITDSIADVEQTDLKNDIEPLKKAAEENAKYIQSQKVSELYNAASPVLRQNSTQDELKKGLDSAKTYTSGNILIPGGKYSSKEFTITVSFTPLGNDKKPAYGVMYLTKSGDQWKLETLQLPSESPAN